MADSLLWAILAIGVIGAALALAAFLRSGKYAGSSKALTDELRSSREESQRAGKELREEVTRGMKATNDSVVKSMETLAKLQMTQLEGMSKQLKELTTSNQTALDRIRAALDERVKALQESNELKIKQMRREVSDGLKATDETLAKTLDGLGKEQQKRLDGMTKELKELTESNRSSLDRIRTTFDARVKELQTGNEKKLEEMRKTVDEKLHQTLEKRLGESFKLVGDQLEAVHKGLGEMQQLATGVGDLKKVLTNVKARGTWAEVQLGAILEQFLTSDQFEQNVGVRENSLERVEYAVRLPGPKNDPARCVWLPIDSKFPQEDFIRLQEAAERGEPDAVAAAAKALSNRVRSEAKDIHDKYVNPPETTDFAIMYLATEGLYAEVLRNSTLVEELQRKYRVVLAGPTTLAAILSSLRMGFQTLAIEQRASEVWRVLGAIKTEFGKFGDVLDKVKKQLNTASRTIDKTGVRTRAIERKLRSVEQLPAVEASQVLALPAAVHHSERAPDEEVESEAPVVDGTN